MPLDQQKQMAWSHLFPLSISIGKSQNKLFVEHVFTQPFTIGMMQLKFSF